MQVSASASAGASGPAFELAKKKNCMACHGVDRKIIGPSFADVAAKYPDDDAWLEPLVKKVREGGSGAWGSVPMPANRGVSDADARTIVSWILDLDE